MIRAVVKLPGQPAEIRDVDADCDGLQALIGGTFTCCFPGELGGLTLWCHDDGIRLKLPANVAIEQGAVQGVPLPVFGPVVVTGREDRHGNSRGLGPAQAEFCRKKLDQLAVGR